MSETITSDRAPERAALIGLISRERDEAEVEISLAELERLLDTAGGEAVVKLTQAKDTPDPATYIGSGKLEELCEVCKNNEITLAVFDDELSPSQIRNIEEEIGRASCRERV